MTTEERLTKLEEDLSTAKRRNRWTMAAALVLVSLLITAIIQKPADEVKARRFIVVDAQGNTRALLYTNEFGMAELNMQDAQRKPRAVLVVLPDGNPMMAFYDAQGRPIWSGP